jgi:hypothetical protein
LAGDSDDKQRTPFLMLETSAESAHAVTTAAAKSTTTTTTTIATTEAVAVSARVAILKDRSEYIHET